MNNEIYNRQQSLELSVPKSVAIVGCGGVGSWVAWFLALAGVEELWLYDHDTVSTSNLNRTPYTLEDVGRPKSEALKDHIRRYRPDCHVYASAGKFVPEVASTTNWNWMVVATDTAKSRQEIYKWAMGALVSYIEVAAEGEMGSCTNEPADFSTPEESHVGYQSVPVWIGPAVAAATMAVSYVLHNASMKGAVLRAGFNTDNGEYELYNSDYQIDMAPEPDAAEVS